MYKQANWLKRGCLALLLMVWLPLAFAVEPLAAAPKKDDGTFLRMHESFLLRAQQGPVGLLFLGDSITAGWKKAPKVWDHYYGAFQPANFGIGGDRLEHVLWRLDHGEVDAIHPKVVVLLMGTNNTATHSAEQIVVTYRQLISVLRHKLPESKILMLAIFPRGPRYEGNGRYDDAVKRMQTIQAVNAELAGFDDGKMVRFLNIGPQFLVDGTIPTSVMPDQLHPNAEGYEIWAKAMQPLLAEMLR